jgi:glycosyltransferase involved in cell wall biosynthesis
MNLLLVSAMFPPIRTGTSFYSHNLACALADRGHSVTVVTLRNREAAEVNSVVPVHRLPALSVPLPGLFKHFRTASVFPSNYLALARIAREMRAEAVLVVNHYLDIVFPAIFAAWHRHIPLVCSVGTQLQSSRTWRDRMLNRLDRLICGKLVFPFCDLVVAWDNEVLRYLSDVHGPGIAKKIVIVNFGPNSSAEQRLAPKASYAIKHQILGVGAVSEQRDFLPLVKAFALIAPRFPQLKLKIIGHVYHDAALRLARTLDLSERIVFTGELPHEQVLAEMQESDLFFMSLSGKYLGLGTAAVEAMFTGLPVLANIPPGLLGNGLELKDMEDFVHADCSDPRQIAERLCLLLADQALRERIGRSGQRFVKEHLNWKKVARDMEAALVDILKAYR